MKLFPNRSFTVELMGDRATALNKLRRNTKLTNKLVSGYTDKNFIGQVGACGFKIISSEIGRGAVCVFLGEFQESIGTVEIRIHNAFKVMFSILMVMPIIASGIMIATQGIESIGIVGSMILAILVVRLVFIELSFRLISRTGFKKLIKMIGIKELNGNEAQYHI
jgi:hypothetical protein